MYNINFDIAALALLFSIAITVHRMRRVKFGNNHLFFLLIRLNIGGGFFDIISSIGIQYADKLPLWLNYTLSLLYYLLVNVTPPIFMLYVLTSINTKFARHKLLYFASFVPSALICLMICSTPFTHYFFYFADDMSYQHGPLLFTVYCVVFYCLFIGTVLIWSFRKTIQRRKRIAFYSFFYFLTIAVIIQFVATDQLIQLFGSAISIMIVSLTIQNPEEIIDSTTGALSRTTFFNHIELNYAAKQNFYVINVSIVNFSTLSRAFGYNGDDDLSPKICRGISAISPKAWVSHINEDCFCIEPECKTAGEIEELVDKIRLRFTQPWKVGDMNTTLPIQICCIYCPGDASNPAELMDIIEYCRPRELQEIVYARDMKYSTLSRKRAVIDALKKAVANNGFRMFYQPIFSTEKRRINSAEALIRLFDDELGAISPEEFIPIAEKEGLILDIGRFAFEDVCRFISENNLSDMGIDYIEINLSVVQCMQKNLAGQLSSIMKYYRVPAEMINLEITETAAANYPEVLRNNMDRLSRDGITFSLDDYGTGYSNITYAYTLPFGYIKIDKSILWSALDNEKAYIALRSTFALAKKLEMKIVMEGVETVEQIRELNKLSCDYMQGYFFSRPIPEEQFLAYISDFRIPEVFFEEEPHTKLIR